MQLLQETHTILRTLNLCRRNTNPTGKTVNYSKNASTEKPKRSKTIPWTCRLLQKICPQIRRHLKKMPVLKNLKEVKQFLGLVGYYRKFVPRFADISRVLTHLTKKHIEFKWTPEFENYFQILKEFLQQAPILKYPDPQASYTLYTDASKYTYAGILTQQTDGTDHPITYISRLFRGSQLNLVTLTKKHMQSICQ